MGDSQKQSCQTCRFRGKKTNRCRRYAPRSYSPFLNPQDGNTSHTPGWPKINPNDWCGEFEEGDSPEEATLKPEDMKKIFNKSQGIR